MQPRRYTRILRLVLIFALCIPILTVPVASQGKTPAQWTVMVYMAANNNLEPNSVFNLMEMAQVGSSDSTNIVVQITRPPDYSGYYGDWGGTRRFLVTPSEQGQLSAGDFQLSVPRLTAYLNAIAADAGIAPSTIDQISRAPRAETEQVVQQQLVPVIDPQVPLPPLQVKSVQDLGSRVNSGQAASLTDFGKWAVENYPAEHYALILWDHGGGWSMIASDDTLNERGIPMPDLQNALKEITAAAGVSKLDVIGFDACLMAQLPVAVTVAPYADYMIASEELVPGLGWNYTPPFQAIASDASPVDVGHAVVDSFVTLYSTSAAARADAFSMSLLDLSKLDGVLQSLDTFAQAYQASTDESVKVVGAARQNVQTFGSVGEASEITDQISSVDLIHLMKLIGGGSKNAALKKATQGVITAAQSMILYQKASPSLPNAKGLSVFFPRNATTYNTAAGARYAKEFGASLKGWQTFLDVFYGKAKAAVAKAPPLKIKVTQVLLDNNKPASIHDIPVISYDTDGKNIVGVSAQVLLKIDGNMNAVLDAFPVQSQEVDADGNTVDIYPDGQSSSDFYWNATLSSISDGKSTLSPVLMTTSAGDNKHGFILGTTTGKRNGKQSPGYLTVDLETYEVDGAWAINAKTSAVSQLTITPGDTFTPDYIVVDEKGNMQSVPYDETLKFGKKPFTVETVPAVDGTYSITLSVTDAAGSTASDTATVEVKNEGIDTTLQGYRDLDFGFKLLYPWDWFGVTATTLEDGSTELYTGNYDGDTYLTINPYDASSLNETAKLAQETLDKLDQVSVDKPTAMTVGKYPARQMNFEYTDADGTQWKGSAVVIYVPENKTGYLFRLEALPEKADEVLATFDSLLGTLEFFEPPQR